MADIDIEPFVSTVAWPLHIRRKNVLEAIDARLDALEAGSGGGLTSGEQVGPVDSDITYDRSTHGDLVTFFYGASVPLTQARTLTFPYDEGVTGGMAIVRVKEDVSNGADCVTGP